VWHFSAERSKVEGRPHADVCHLYSVSFSRSCCSLAGRNSPTNFRILSSPQFCVNKRLSEGFQLNVRGKLTAYVLSFCVAV